MCTFTFMNKSVVLDKLSNCVSHMALVESLKCYPRWSFYVPGALWDNRRPRTILIGGLQIGDCRFFGLGIAALLVWIYQSSVALRYFPR